MSPSMENTHTQLALHSLCVWVYMKGIHRHIKYTVIQKPEITLIGCPPLLFWTGSLLRT